MTERHASRMLCWRPQATGRVTKQKSPEPHGGRPRHDAYKGKWHLSDINHGVDFHSPRCPETSRALEPWGFSDYSHDGDHHGPGRDGLKHDAAIAADAANWLLGVNGSKESGKPWFMAVNFINPHDIMFYDATGTMTKERLDPLRDAPLLPAPASPLYDERLALDLPKSFSDDLESKPVAHRRDLQLADIMYGFLPKEKKAGWRNHRNYYYNCVHDVDRNVDFVLDALERSGEADRTIVIFTSDHGEMAGAHGMRQKGASMYKEIVRVSLFVSHPDIRSPVETDALATSIDLVPTTLDMLGLTKGEVEARWPALRGVSLVPRSKAAGRNVTRAAAFSMTRRRQLLPEGTELQAHGRGLICPPPQKDLNSLDCLQTRIFGENTLPMSMTSS